MLITVFLFFFFFPCRVEDEAVLDRGASFVKHVCDEEEVEGELRNKYLRSYQSNRPAINFNILNSMCFLHRKSCCQRVMVQMR